MKASIFRKLAKMEAVKEHDIIDLANYYFASFDEVNEIILELTEEGFLLMCEDKVNCYKVLDNCKETACSRK